MARRFQRTGGDPLDLDVPLQPSYEDRPGAPDRVLARVPPALAARQVLSWERALTAAGAARPAAVRRAGPRRAGVSVPRSPSE